MIITEYKNGDTKVSLYSDGTKVREYYGEGNPLFPESIDVKITNYCDKGCAYCHENSNKQGKHGDLDILFNILSPFPSGIELAIGGGNPLSHPDLYGFLVKLKERGFIPNLTVNEFHFDEYRSFIQRLIDERLVYGIGISYRHDIEIIKKAYNLSKNIVVHMIAGVNDVEEIEQLKEIDGIKLLILGYKQFGQGINYFSSKVSDNLKQWYMRLPSYFKKVPISFDNLAIEQLNIKRFFEEKEWDKFYMGDDFTFTMYIDAVEQQFAPTSRSKDRVSFKEMSLLEYFSKKKMRLIFL